MKEATAFSVAEKRQGPVLWVLKEPPEDLQTGEASGNLEPLGFAGITTLLKVHTVSLLSQFTIHLLKSVQKIRKSHSPPFFISLFHSDCAASSPLLLSYKIPSALFSPASTFLPLTFPVTKLLLLTENFRST